MSDLVSIIMPSYNTAQYMCNWNNIYISTYGKERFIY